MQFLCDFYEILLLFCVLFICNYYATSLEFLFNIYAISMQLLWNFYSISMQFLCNLYAITLHFLCIFDAISFQFQFDFACNIKMQFLCNFDANFSSVNQPYPGKSWWPPDRSTSDGYAKNPDDTTWPTGRPWEATGSGTAHDARLFPAKKFVAGGGDWKLWKDR